MRVLAVLSAAGLLLGASPPTAAPLNPQIDYAGFAALTSDLAQARATHRLAWAEFAKRARAEGALLLDARSADAFARGHLEGAVNLPFTDFTDEALAKVIGPDRQRPIYIYCNNNFSDDADPVVTKRVQLALNIPTFINLHGYGYRNVWELADVIGTGDAGVEWEAAAGG